MIGYFRQVKATIVFKHNVDSLNRVDEEYEDHWEFEAGGEIELKPEAKAEVGKEGVKAGVGVGGPKVTGKVRHDNKNKHIKKLLRQTKVCLNITFMKKLRKKIALMGWV